MIHNLRAIAASLMISGTVILPANAQLSTLSQLQQDFQVAVCQQNWNQAIDISDQILALDGVNAEYRNYVLSHQQQLRRYQQDSTLFDFMSWCTGGQGASIQFNSSENRWQRAMEAISTMRPYWSGHCHRGSQPCHTIELPSSGSGSGGSGSSGSSGSGGGGCATADDIAADGSRCGGRAASER